MKIEKEKMMIEKDKMKIIRNNDQQNQQNNDHKNGKNEELINVPTLIQYEKNHIKKQKIRNRIQKLSNKNDMKDERNFQPSKNQNHQNENFLPSYSSSFIWGQSYQYKNRPTSHPNYHVI